MRCPSFDPHDHAACRADALDRAEAGCAARRLQLTPVRRRVLELLLAAPRAQGAYDLLENLRQERLGSQPPVVYRALDFLVRNGFAHRLEKLNAYVACARSGPEPHDAAFLICDECGRVAETCGEAPARLGQAAHAAGFDIERVVVEALGRCPACRMADRPEMTDG